MLKRLKKQVTDRSHKEKESEMNGRAAQAWQEVDAYVEAYQEHLTALVKANGEELSEYQFGELKKQARASAGERYPQVQLGVDARSRQCGEAKGNGTPTGETEWQKVGQTVFSKSGNATKEVRRRYLVRATEDSEDSITIERSGFTRTYQEYALQCDLIPPDPLVAVLGGMTDEGVGTARHSAKKDGFEFERVSVSSLDIWQKSAGHGWWRVTKRPEKEAPESELDLATVLSSVSKKELLEAMLTILSRQE